MADYLSPLQKAALDFLIEAKKVDDFLLAVCLNNNGGVGEENAQIAATANQQNNWAMVQQLFDKAGQQVGQHMNFQQMMNTLTVQGDAVAPVAVAGAAVGPAAKEITEVLPATPADVSLKDLIKLRHGLR